MDPGPLPHRILSYIYLQLTLSSGVATQVTHGTAVPTVRYQATRGYVYRDTLKMSLGTLSWILVVVKSLDLATGAA